MQRRRSRNQQNQRKKQQAHSHANTSSSQPTARPQQISPPKKKNPTATMEPGPQYRRGQLWELQSLPHEVLYHVLIFIGPHEVLTTVLRLNHFFYNLGTDSLLWKDFFCSSFVGESLDQFESTNLTWQEKWKRFSFTRSKYRGRCKGLDKLCLPPLKEGSSEKKQLLFKVCMVGNSGAGKTSLINRYVTNRFQQQYRATIGVDFLIKKVEVQGRECCIQLWDTAGPERFRSLGNWFYRGADGLVVNFELHQKYPHGYSQPVESVPLWFNEFANLTALEPEKQMNFPVIVTGNKSDLYDETNDTAAQKQEQGVMDWCHNMHIPYIRTSAKEGTNVKEAFDLLLEQMIIAHYKQTQHVYVGPPIVDNALNTTNEGHCYTQFLCLLLTILLPTLCICLVFTSIRVFDIY